MISLQTSANTNDQFNLEQEHISLNSIGELEDNFDENDENFSNMAFMEGYNSNIQPSLRIYNTY